MENSKPNNFKEASVSHIPQSIVESMLRQTSVSVEGMSPLEAIAKEVGKGPLPQKVETPQQEQFISIAVDGNVIKVPGDSFKAMVTMFAYYMATIGYKDKKINKILKAFNFKMADANGLPIYPKEKKK